MDFHGLLCVLGIFRAFLMYHDLLDEQPQQFRGQFRDVSVLLGFCDKAVSIGYGILQPLNGTLLLRNTGVQTGPLSYLAVREHLKLLHRNVVEDPIFIEFLENGV